MINNNLCADLNIMNLSERLDLQNLTQRNSQHRPWSSIVHTLVRSFTRSFARSLARSLHLGRPLPRAPACLITQSLHPWLARSIVSPIDLSTSLFRLLARSFVQSFACRGQRGSSSINDIKVDQLYRGLEFQSVNVLGNVFNAPYSVELAAELASN